MDKQAEEYANKTIGTDNLHEAPFITLGDVWDFVYEAYKAGKGSVVITRSNEL